MSKSFDFQAAPGHLIRRAHQTAVALFMQEAGNYGMTPVQFAVMNALIDEPGLDQVSLAARVAFDAATSGSVLGRLESKGWIKREADPQDRRRKLLWATREGEQTVQQMRRAVARVQERILAPLDKDERMQLQHLLHKLVYAQRAS